jgi:hypothetical protein
MGEDLLQYGYLPTYAYGQSYLFSLLPYVYAGIRWLVPTLSQVMALKLAGFALSITGLGLLFEALLLAQRKTGWARGVAATTFCLLLASSCNYLFDIQEHSSLEISLFALGLISFFAARIELALAERGPGRGADWLLFGLGLAHALYSRPLVFAYGLVLLIWLVAAAWRRAPGWPLRRSLYGLLAGALIGYLPMLLHLLLRAPTWPYDFHTATLIGRCEKPYPGLITFWKMFCILFDLRLAHPVYTALTGAWLLVTLLAFIGMLRRARQHWLTALDLALPLGSLCILGVMVLIPNFSVNVTERRYCEHVVLAAIWLFARFAPQLLCWRWSAVALAAGVGLASLASWQERLRYEVHVNATLAKQLPAVVAELQRHHAPILAGFWDAYQLRFISGGTLPIEAYPWDFVRTFNAIPRVAMQQRCLWLVREDFIPFMRKIIKEKFRPTAQQARSSVYLRSPLLLRRFEYSELDAPATPAEWERWEAGRLLLLDLDPNEAVRLMLRYYPRYFSTPNPPRP